MSEPISEVDRRNASEIFEEARAIFAMGTFMQCLWIAK
jgi:hypothetical protein